MLASGGTGYGHGINIARSKQLYGPYESCPHNPVMRQTDPQALIQRSGHGMPVVTQNGEWWCLYLCGRRNEGNYTTVGRETALDRIIWDDNGWFRVGDGVPSVSAVVPELDECVYTHERSFDFRGGIPVDFEWVRNPDKSLYTIGEDGLTLYTGDYPLYAIGSKNTLLHREEELSYCAELEFEFTPESEGQQAGLVCYYSTVSYVSLARVLGGIELVINRNNGEELITSLKLSLDKKISFKVEVKGLERSFYYRDGDNWRLIYRLEDCIYLCDEGVKNDPKRHTGTLVGMYCNNSGKGGRVPMVIKRFKYNNIKESC
jgi:xylan 1,4-beta-xylosidase